MGLHSRHEWLVMRWTEMCNDPTLDAIPFKIELNKYGTIEVTPPTTRHGRFQARIAGELMVQLPQGTVLTGCGVVTDEGVRAPDVMWASAAFMARNGDDSPLLTAPELCIEVLSPSNTDDEMVMKTAAYLGAGAQEVWLVAQSGTIAVHTSAGLQERSRFQVQIELAPL